MTTPHHLEWKKTLLGDGELTSAQQKNKHGQNGNCTDCASGFERYGRRKQVIHLLAINEGNLRLAILPPHSLPQTLHLTG